MISTLSLILAIMLTISGNPAVSVGPVHSIKTIEVGSDLSSNIIEKPLLGKFLKNRLFKRLPTADNLSITSVCSIRFEKVRLVGYYYYRHRYFMPRIGRFLQTDPKQYVDSLNLYAAFNQNPVNFRDPYGTSFLTSGFGDYIDRPGDKRKRGRELKLIAEGAVNLGLTASQWLAHWMYSCFDSDYSNQPWNYTKINFTEEGSIVQFDLDTRNAYGKALGIITDPIKGATNCVANYCLTFDTNIRAENKIQFYENAVRETPGTIMVITGLTKGTRVLASKANTAITSNPGFQNTLVLMDEAFANNRGFGLKPGQPIPSNLEIVVTGSSNKPGSFILRNGIDDLPIGNVTTPGKSASIATDLTLNTEISKMFNRLPKRGDILSGAFVEDIRAAGFDVIFTPTIKNPYHVRIIPKTRLFDQAGRNYLSSAFDKIAQQK